MIASALACQPELLIADEPTTALDVTIQAQILDLIRQMKERSGTTVLLITHDMGVVAGLAQRIVILYAGCVMETGTTDEIFYPPIPTPRVCKRPLPVWTKWAADGSTPSRGRPRS